MMAPHEPATVESLRRRNPEAATRRAGVRVIISATFLGIGGIRTHLVLLCQLLRRHGIGVTVFATDVRWDAETMTGLEKTGVKFQLPPQWIRASRKLSALYCGLTWPWLVPGRAAAVYCISPGYSHLLMHRLKPAQALSINHEIVEPPDPQSADGKRAGKCAARLDASVANSHKVARLMKGYWPEKPIQARGRGGPRRGGGAVAGDLSGAVGGTEAPGSTGAALGGNHEASGLDGGEFGNPGL